MTELREPVDESRSAGAALEAARAAVLKFDLRPAFATLVSDLEREARAAAVAEERERANDVIADWETEESKLGVKLRIQRVGKVRDRRSTIINSNVKFVTVHKSRSVDLHIGGATHDWIVTLTGEDIDKILSLLGENAK